MGSEAFGSPRPRWAPEQSVSLTNDTDLTRMPSCREATPFEVRPLGVLCVAMNTRRRADFLFRCYCPGRPFRVAGGFSR